MTAKRSHSSLPTFNVLNRVGYWGKLLGFMLRERSPLRKRDFSWLFEDVSSYRSCVERFVGRHLEQCRVLEIGFGTRPHRVTALYNLGVDAMGVDLDVPVLRFADVARAFRANGFERAVKSSVRHLLFDLTEHRQFAGVVARKSGRTFEVPRERLITADVTDPAFWRSHPGPYDLIYSEDVFEHIPSEDLRRLMPQIAAHLSATGIALIRPLIWTGIRGGHHVEYYNYKGGNPPRSVPPWDHLRQRKVVANTYLNELTRRNYITLFGEHFEVLEDRELEPGLGRHLLNDDLRRELTSFDDYELLSNKVSFILRLKKR